MFKKYNVEHLASLQLMLIPNITWEPIRRWRDSKWDFGSYWASRHEVGFLRRSSVGFNIKKQPRVLQVTPKKIDNVPDGILIDTPDVTVALIKVYCSRADCKVYPIKAQSIRSETDIARLPLAETIEDNSAYFLQYSRMLSHNHVTSWEIFSDYPSIYNKFFPDKMWSRFIWSQMKTGNPVNIVACLKSLSNCSLRGMFKHFHCSIYEFIHDFTEQVEKFRNCNFGVSPFDSCKRVAVLYSTVIQKKLLRHIDRIIGGIEFPSTFDINWNEFYLHKGPRVLALLNESDAFESIVSKGLGTFFPVKVPTTKDILLIKV